MINNLLKKIDTHLAYFLNDAKKIYSLDIVHPILFKGIKEYPLRSGKRIRPLLFLLSYLGYKKGNNKIPADIYRASLSIELLHNFMLIHDDIIDNSDLRRGKPSMHKILSKIGRNISSEKLGSNLAIVEGDIVYALAFHPLINVKTPSSRKEKALNVFIKTTIETAMGEFIDTIHGLDSLKNVKEKDAFLNYRLKTSRYTFACPMIMGAIFAGAKDNELKILSELGTLAGEAFQIQDDIIGIFGNEKKIGKSIISDLAESKKTLLVCHAFLHLKGKDKKLFTEIFNKKKKTIKDLKNIRKLMLISGSLNYCINHMQNRIKKALNLINKLRIKNTQKKEIENIILKMTEYSRTLL